MAIKKLLGLVLTALAFTAHTAQSAPLPDLTGGQIGRIEYTSSNPAHRWDMIRKKIGPAQTVWGDLLMPKDLSKPVPVMVISHGSDGVSSHYYDLWANRLNQAGIAVFIVDHFTPRGKQDILGPEKQLNYEISPQIIDMVFALKLLATHPNIDKQRIYQMGFSRGGNAVLNSATRPFMNSVDLPSGLKWAGTVPVYPGCVIRHRTDDNERVLSAPMLFLLGEKDNHTPAKDCVAYAQDLKDKGSDIRYIVYENALHLFDKPDLRYNESKQGSYSKCSIDIWYPKGPVDNNYQFGGMDRVTGKRWSTVAELQAAYKNCEFVDWIKVEANPKAREAAVKEVIYFVNTQK